MSISEDGSLSKQIEHEVVSNILRIEKGMYCTVLWSPQNELEKNKCTKFLLSCKKRNFRILPKFIKI